jgi:hypothetical protein
MTRVPRRCRPVQDLLKRPAAARPRIPQHDAPIPNQERSSPTSDKIDCIFRRSRLLLRRQIVPYTVALEHKTLHILGEALGC